MSAVETTAKPAVIKKVKDAQTGKDFDIIPEGRIDIVFAWISAAYSLAVIGFLTWLVLNILYGQPATAAFPSLAQILSGSTSKLIFYTAVGGAIGAAVNNLRSFIAWHAEERAFGWRFIWKYLAMPPIGGTLAVLVYGILQGGAAVITGASAPADGQASAMSSLSVWATGALAGYGSHNVFKWLDDKVNTLFKIDSKQATVPDARGKLLEEAKQMVTDAQLKVGTITEAPASSDQVGKVIAQTPGAGTQIDCGSKVDLTVGIAGGQENDPNKLGTTDLAAKPQDNGTMPQNGKPATAGEPATGETAAVTNTATVTAGTTAGGTATGTVVGTDVSVHTDDPTKTDTSSAADGGQTNNAQVNASDNVKEEG